MSSEDKSNVSVQYGDFKINDIDCSVIALLGNHKDRRAIDSLVFQLPDEQPNPIITKENAEAYAKFFTDKAYFIPKRTSPSPEWINSVDRIMTRFNNVMAGISLNSVSRLAAQQPAQNPVQEDSDEKPISTVRNIF